MAENRFQKYAQQQPQVFYQDPSAVRDEQREDERLRNERERLLITRENALRAAENDRIDREEREAEQAQSDKDAAALEAAQRSQVRETMATMRTVIAKAKEAKARSNDWFATGFGADTALDWGGSAAADVRELLAPIKANQAFTTLQKMREASPTGGALGAVSERELALLQSTITGLEQTQSDVQFQYAMDEIVQRYTRALAALEDGDRYYRENGSMEGYVGLSEEDLANFSLDGNTPPSGNDLAGAGATTTTYELPQEYQDRHAAYLRQNWGNITPDGYAQFRAGLDNEFSDVASPDLEAYRNIVPAFNKMAAEGQPPEAAGSVPAATREMSAVEQGINDFVTSPFGTGATSAINSATFGVPDALAGRRLQAAQELNPKSAFAGDLVGGTVGSILGGGGAAMAGAGRFAPVVGDVGYSTIFGGLSDDDPVMGALLGATTGIAGDQLGRLGGKAIARFRSPDDPLSEGQRAIVGSIAEQDEVIDALTRADALGVPMTLADASPELQALAGSAVRFSPTTAGQARQAMAMRNQGQLDRLGEAVERDLGPIENIPQRSADLMQQARDNAGPLYDYAYASPGAEDVDILDLANRPSFQPALKEAFKQAQEEGMDPRIMGFVMDDAGEVSINPDAFGGMQRARVNAESNILQPRTIRAYGGREVTKQGPLDLVGWLRTQGGLRDSGGELSNMGLTNKARGKNAELVGRESEFGPLVNPDDGLDFDTAALYAWEAGYFPELSERPDINTFLDAMRDSAEGISQRFKVDDLPEVEAYRAARDSNTEIRNANAMDGGMWEDVSQPAGMREAAPAEAYGSEQMVGLNWQGLDYLQRGLRSVVDNETDAVTGKMTNYGRLVNDTHKRLLSRMDAINPEFRDARRAYAGPMQEQAFLQQGIQATKTRPDELAVQLADLTPEQRQQMQLGFQSETMARAGDLRNNSNAWAQLNTPNTERRLGALYGEDTNIAQLLDQRDLELQLAGSANRLIGNSATAEREIADEFFKQRTGMGGDVAMGVIETGALGGPWLTVGKGLADRAFKDRRERAAAEANRALADELGPLLLSDSPQGAIDSLTSMAAQDADYRAILEALTESGERWGRRVGTGVAAAGANTWGY